MKNNIFIWAPFRGRVGTIEAILNYKAVLQSLEQNVQLIEIGKEWSEITQSEKDDIVGLGNKIGQFLGRSNIMHRRDFFLFSVLLIPFLRIFLKRTKPDIVICGLLSAPMLIAARGLPIKIFVSVQGYPKILLSRKMQSKYFNVENNVRRVLWKHLYSRADKLICMTSYTSKRLIKEFPTFVASDVLTLPNPLFNADSAQLPSKIQYGPIKKVIFIGRWTQQKGIDFLKKIIADTEITEKYEFHIYGEISFDQRQKLLSKNVYHHGIVENVWAQIDPKNSVNLITALWEDPGHVFLEGLANNVRTLVIDADSPHVDLAKKYNVTVVERSLSELKSALTTYNCDKISQIALRVRSDYSFQKFKSRLSEILDD